MGYYKKSRSKKAKNFKRKTYSKKKIYTKKSYSNVSKMVTKIVKSALAKNIENKVTEALTVQGNPLTVTSTESSFDYTYFVYNPQQDSDVLTIPQGVSEAQRIGNKIKLKRWVIKGTVYANPEASNNVVFPDLISYVDVYFGRSLDITQSFNDTLPLFYVDGATPITPSGALVERLYSVNKDKYKVYWHKRFKIGPASGSIGIIPNNDFKVSQTFGFDVCKYVLKNKVLKFDDDTDNIPNDALLQSLTVWATISLPSSDVIQAGSPGIPIGTFLSPVSIALSTYAEYEDA